MKTPEGNPWPIPSEECMAEVRRLMKNRVLNVKLNPVIEKACMGPLATMCSTGFTKNHFDGNELDCLRKNIHKLQAYPNCRKVLNDVSKVEHTHAGEINGPISTTCKPEVGNFCKDSIGTKGAVLKCLIKNKNRKAFSPQCRAHIFHAQLMSIENVELSVAFSNACKWQIDTICSKDMESKNKKKVLDCLAYAVREDVALERSPRVSKDCQTEMHAQLLARRKKFYENLLVVSLLFCFDLLFLKLRIALPKRPKVKVSKSSCMFWTDGRRDNSGLSISVLVLKCSKITFGWSIKYK